MREPPRTDPYREADVVVVGAGLAGLCCALHLLWNGHDVLLLDPRPERGPATWAAAGMLSPLPEAPAQKDLLPLLLRALDFYPGFLDALHAREGLERLPIRRGTILLARSDGERDELDAVQSLCEEEGLETRRLDATALRRFEPGLARGLHGGLFLPQVGWLDHRRLQDLCRRALGRRGVPILPELATDLAGHEGRVEGVVTVQGWIRSRRVVDAAGAWSASFLPEGPDGRGTT